jgi:hypothetical protein
MKKRKIQNRPVRRQPAPPLETDLASQAASAHAKKKRKVLPGGHVEHVRVRVSADGSEVISVFGPAPNMPDDDEDTETSDADNALPGRLDLGLGESSGVAALSPREERDLIDRGGRPPATRKSRAMLPRQRGGPDE